jgi:predicted TIM-barrel fold metal-dependent hydrolase
MNRKIYYLSCFLLIAVSFFCCTEKSAWQSLSKIDSHVHIDTLDPAFAQQAEADGFRLLTIMVGSTNSAKIEKQRTYAVAQSHAHPKTVFWVTTFSMEGFEQPDWVQKTIAQLEKDFVDGAIGVKVWKDIGMVIRDQAGRFVMIDDPRLDSVFEFIAKRGKPVVAHIGEPHNCWLPLEQMTVNNDRNYFQKHPDYHMYLHPDFPSYKIQIACRDHWLEKNPDLKVIGAHLGSLEYDVDELAKRLDRFANFSVDLSARICHFQVQDRDKVRRFIEKYQDRLLYGTDSSADAEQGAASVKRNSHSVWQADWMYFSTDHELTSDNVNGKFRGLNLATGILGKVYHDNACRWLGLSES